MSLERFSKSFVPSTGYPPPGVTHGGDPLPPPAGYNYPPGSYMAQHQIPVYGHPQEQPPMAQTFGPPYEQSSLDQTQHQPTYVHPQSPANQPPMYGYAPLEIPTDGQSLPSALPYSFHPPGHQPAAATGVVIDDSNDPVIIEELKRTAELVAREETAKKEAEAAAAAVVTPAAPVVKDPMASRPFYIVSECNKSVLDVRKDNPKPGTPVGLYKKKPSPSPNQLWYRDEEGYIRSKLSDLALGAEGNNKELHTAAFTGDARQKWIIEGNKIVNQVFCDECLTVKKSLVRVKDDAEVIAAKYEGKPTQHWEIEYCG